MNVHRRRTILGFTLLTVTILGLGTPVAEAAEPAAALRTLPLGPGVTRQNTGPFSMIGVTWADPRQRLDAHVEVRTRSAGRWTGWQTLEADGGIKGRRGATDPLWVGPSDGVQTRIAGRRLPAGLRLDLINPEAPEVRPQGWAMSPVAARIALPTRPVPRMVTRSGWGADEAIVAGPPEYTGPVEVVFVHHTASGNGYRCAQSASIVRGIQAYQVRSRGWDDIGYNFLVDRCGTIFEGRGGGVGRPVLGAHTLGFNENAAAIAVIGNYDRAGVSARVRTAIATVAAYKLSAAGNYPNSSVALVSKGGDRFGPGARAVFPRIAGHRTAGRTACPGDALFAQLPAIRAIAGGGPVALRTIRMAGAVRSGPYFFTKGLLRPLWDLSTPSSLISRFEVWVDGRPVVATPGTHRGATVRLTPGGHTVIVRALHLSGRSATVTTRVVADPNAPVFAQAPDVTLRPGPLTTTVPIRLNWRATDPNLLGVGLVSPSRVNFGTVATSRTGAIRPAAPTTFVLRAVDRAGNSVNASVTRTPMIVSEAAAQRSGVWRVQRNPAHLGGAALSGARGATATWTFTGRSVAIVAGRAATSGQVRIFLDGEDQGAVDLRSPRTAYRQAVWARSWPGSAQHTVRVRVDRPGVALDGMISLK